MKSERVVEAELFAASKPLSVSELQIASGLDARTVRSALKRLMEEYNGSDRAIEVAKMGPRYAMQVKKEYLAYAYPLAETKIPRDVLKTASLVAYYQPVLQSKLFELIGSKVYQHVKTLADMGLVRTKPKKNSVQITTTKKFIEVFGIDARSRDEVKAWFESELSKRSGKRPP